MEEEHAIDLTGQVALVTGGGRGIGRAIARALSGVGASVVICARSEAEVVATAKEIEDQGGRSRALRVDVSNRLEVERMIAEVCDVFGPIDLLVNNAGIHGPMGPLATADPDHWWDTMSINVRGALYCSRGVLPYMVEQRRGRIVNVASGAGLGTWPMMSAYTVSKAALVKLTESIAVETLEHGVHVFVISPGLVRTAMTTEGLGSDQPGVSRVFASWFSRGNDVPPERAAELVVYLASGAADALSGRYIDIRSPMHPNQLEIRDMVAQAQDIREHDLYVMRLRE